ncbi:MAG: hypothetical protein Q4B90_07350 [Eubacteriales bacterium]|nr:hypothetical protein [Eubacteriales bacterium]
MQKRLVNREQDAIVAGLEVSSNAVLNILAGKVELNGLLPMQFPQDKSQILTELSYAGIILPRTSDRIKNQ